MPLLGKGTECIKLLLTQVSKDMHEPLVPMLFAVLGAYVSGSEFQYPDLSWKELCGMLANLVADSGCNKGQFTNLVEAICRDFRIHDEGELQKLVCWQKQGKSKEGTNGQIRKWLFRKFITYCNQTGLYTKTDEYLKGKPNQ